MQWLYFITYSLVYCFKCGSYSTKVTDSRTSSDGKAIRRRRECENCANRFTTFERVENSELIISKLGNRKERYNREKLEDSILKATNKRNISVSQINAILSVIELELGGRNEVSSTELGEIVLQKLKEIDEVAYTRYASVHLKFTSADDFIYFIQKHLH